MSDYDRAHFYTFSLLLDGETESASEHDMAHIVFGLDVHRDTRALVVVRSHLERAHWLMANGYSYLNW